MHANYLVTPGPIDLLTPVRFSMWSGVDLFFAISGFLISRPFIRSLVTGAPLPRAGDYLVRRAARLLPAYWIALVVMVFAAVRPPGVATFVSHLFLVHDLVPGEPKNFYPVAWTLGVEAEFYLLVPAVAATVRRLRPRPVSRGGLAAVVAVVWVLSAALSLQVYRVAGPEPEGPAQVALVSLPALLFLFCPGMLLAVFIDARPRWPGLLLALANPAVGLPVGVELWLLSIGLNLAHTATSTFVQDQVLAAGSGVLVLVAVAPRAAPNRFVRAIGHLGTISYGIYLWHWIVLLLLLRLTGLRTATGAGDVQWLTSWVTIVAITLVPATLSWIWVERPAINWSTRGRKRRTADLAAQPRRPHLFDGWSRKQ